MLNIKIKCICRIVAINMPKRKETQNVFFEGQDFCIEPVLLIQCEKIFCLNKAQQF